MAAKVYDGLFLGDAETSMDSDFLDLNKISRLVNVSGQQVQNVLSGHGFVYQTFCWDDQTDFLVFPAMEKDKALLEMVEFIDTSLRKGLSVLVFSFRGRSRNAFAICAFLMYKYNWGFEKSFDFILSKKSDLQINQGFVQQLFALEKRLSSKRQKLLRTNDELNEPEGPARERLRRKEWDPAYLASSFSMTGGSHKAKNGRDKSRSQNSDEFSDNDGEDELLLVNSFLNGKNTITSLPGPYRNVYDIQKYFKLRFNSVLLEEDVHVFPTSPPSRYDPPKGHKSILKMKRVPNVHVNGEDHVETFSEGSKVAKALPQFPSTPSVDVSATRPSTASHRSHIDESPNIRQPVAAARSRGNSMDDSTAAQYRAAVGQDLEISNGRGGQQVPPSSFKQPRDISAASECTDIYSSAVGDQPKSSSTSINGKVRSSQTAEDRLRHLMQDMRVTSLIDSAPKDEEKLNRSGSSRGYKDMDNYSSTGVKDRTYREYENASELTTDRRNSNGGDTTSRPATADAKGKHSYRPNESLSLYDLAALPLHSDDPTSGRESKHRNSNSYGTPNGYSVEDLRASVSARKSEGSNDRIALLRAEEMRERERDTAYLQLRESQQDRRREYDRDVDPLSMFQQQGQEAAVRVRYTSMPLPVNTSTPNKTVRNAWNDDYRDIRGNGDGGRASGDRDRTALSARGVSSNQSVDSRSSDRMSVTSQPREREREKAALRTYRHGSPAPSRVSSSSRASATSSTSRGFSFPSSAPSSSAPNGQRSRAASPSTPGSAVRGSSPGSGSMNRDNDVSRSSRAGSNNSFIQNPQRRSSFESGSGSGSGPLDESRYVPVPDISIENSRGYSVSGFRGSTASSVANRFTRPPSPGTRKGVGTLSFTGSATGYMGTTQSNSRSSTPTSARSSTPTNGRSSTPPRGNWRF